MPTDRIEIYPGCTIDVNQRHKKGAGLPRSAKLKKYAMSESERKAVFGEFARDERPKVKYPTLLLDEAVELSKTVGEKKACKITGVGYWSMKGRKRDLIRQGKYIPSNHRIGRPRYTMVQKQACVALAKQLMADPTRVLFPHPDHRLRKRGFKASRPKWGRGSAFAEAGRRLGMNGSSVEFMFLQNMIDEPSSPPR